MFKKISILFIAMAWLFLAHNALAKAPSGHELQKPGVQADFLQTLSNIQNFSYWVRNDGLIGRSPISGNSGGIYPRGTSGVVFAEGIIWGGFLPPSVDTNPRVGGQTYVIGTQSGWITTPGDGVNPPVAVPSDDPRARVYRIRRDYQSLSVDDPGMRLDAAEHAEKSVSDVTDSEVQFLIDQYATDWENWPVDLGAPFYDANGNGTYEPGVEVDLNGNGTIEIGEREEPGLAGADQVIFFVANDMDDARTTSLYGSQPIGLELQVTVWGYNQPDATLGQMLFKRFRFINKSGYQIDSMFVSQWVDPDVGNYTDDLAGCDVPRSIGFAYSGFLTDDDFSGFNLPPASVGFDFFQGPMVAGAPEDTAIFDFKKFPGFRNLPMTSFIFFAAGSPISDPPLGDFDGTLEWYNMLNGFTPTTDLANPTPYIAGAGENAGQPTKFPLSGDPFLQTGDIDAFGNNFGPGDRRIALNSGPFNLPVWDDVNGNGQGDAGEPGVQEIVVAVVGGIVAQEGGNNRNAVAQMKINDDFAQFLYDRLFQGIPKPPIKPRVSVAELDREIVLDWGSDIDAYQATEADDPVLGFNFEGYNVYQLPRESATKSQAMKIATFDKNNFITTIRGKKFVPEFGDILEVPIQQGRDTGIQRYISIKDDAFTGAPLNNGSKYFFAVTAYNFNPDPTVPEPSIESALEVIPAVPQAPAPGTAYNNETGDMIEVTRISGGSTGSVEVMVVDPKEMKDMDYRVTFNTDPQYVLDPITDSTGQVIGYDTLGTWFTWNINGGGQTLISNQANLSGDNSYPLVNGLLVKVKGPTAAGLAGWDYDGNRWFSGVNWGGQEFFGGLDIGANFFGSELGPADLVPVHLEFQDQASVDANGFASKGATYRRDLGYPFSGIGELPITSWDVFDPDNPRRLNICFVEDENASQANGTNANLIWDMAWNGSEFPSDGLGGREYLFFMKSDYSEGAGYDDNNWGPAADVLYAIWPKERGSRAYLLAEFTMDIFANLPNTVDDVFAFSTKGYVSGNTDLAKDQVDQINVFPNPYYAYHSQETNRFDRNVTFSHLPDEATIRIFNLAGEQVKKIEHASSNQFEQWDLRNEAGLPVASGLYVAHIDMPKLNKTKVLKLYIIQRAEILEFF